LKSFLLQRTSKETIYIDTFRTLTKLVLNFVLTGNCITLKMAREKTEK